MTDDTFEEAARRIADAIGAEEGDTIVVRSSQHERRDGIEPAEPPLTEEAFDALRTLPEDDLADLGLRCWADDVWLLPGEWFAHIPEGVEVIDIFDERREFDRDEMDDATRFGCLAYGIERETGDE